MSNNTDNVKNTESRSLSEAPSRDPTTTTTSTEAVENSTSQSHSMSKFTSLSIDSDGQELTSPAGETLSTKSSPDLSPPPPTESKKDMSLQANKKYLSLLVLVVQNTALVLTMRYSRTVTTGPMYLASTAVVLTELLKFIICVSMIFHSSDYDAARTITLLKTEIIDKKSETLRLSVPSVLYTIQNNLLYIALSHLDAATFQVSPTMLLNMYICNYV